MAANLQLYDQNDTATKTHGVTSIKICFETVRQFILELVRSYGLQAHKALALTENLEWTNGNAHFSVTYFHSRNSWYTQHLMVASLVPTEEYMYQQWWELELIERLMSY